MASIPSKRPSLTPTRGTATRSKTPMPMTATSPPPPKRRRTASLEADLLTPPLLEEEDPLCSRSNVVEQSDDEDDNDDHDEDLFSHAAHVLATEAAALASITSLYSTNMSAKKNLKSAVETILQSQRSRGKLIVSGVGKSAYIGQKLVATCKSMGVATSFMHACEAAHGDLGDIREVSCPNHPYPSLRNTKIKTKPKTNERTKEKPKLTTPPKNDTILFISHSGKTPELLNLLPHIPPTTPILAMSSQTSRPACPLLTDRAPKLGILLPAPIPVSEEASFGVSAPTTSTTVALAVSDMLALTVAERLHRGGSSKREVFKRNHPGGAIGMSQRELGVVKRAGVEVEAIELPSPSISANDEG